MERVKGQAGSGICGAILFPFSAIYTSSYDLYNSPAAKRERGLHPALISTSKMMGMAKAETFEEFLVEEEEKGISECSSGCQSGWTLYLGQTQDSHITSLLSPVRHDSAHEEEEEDLSMLSDASSGPPHVKEDDFINFYYCSNDETGCLSSGASLSLNAFAKSGGKRRRFEEEAKKQQKKIRQQEPCSSFLEDTASSPLLCIYKPTGSNSSSSCSFSANHFKVSRQEGEKKTALKRRG